MGQALSVGRLRSRFLTAHKAPDLALHRPNRLEHVLVLFALLASAAAARALAADGGDEAGSPAAQVLWLFLYLGAGIGLWRSRARAVMLVRQSIPVLFLLGFGFLTTLWSADPFLSARRAFGLIGSTSVAYYIVSRFALEDFLGIFVVAEGITALLSLALVVLMPSVGIMQDVYVGTWQGVFNDKNALGFFMALGLISILTLGFHGRRRVVIGRIAVYLLCALLLLGSQSMTSVGITMLATSTAFGVYAYRHGGVARGIALVLVGLMIVVPVVATLLGFQASMIFDAVGRDATLTGRTEIWPLVMNAVSDRPLQGYGYDVFWIDDGPFEQYIPVSAGWRPYHSHEGYLELMLDMGMIGLGLYLTIFAQGVRKAVLFISHTMRGIALWPFLIMLYFLILNFAESRIAKYNQFDWIIFIIAYLYAQAREPQCY